MAITLASCSSASVAQPTNTPSDTLTPSSTPKPTETLFPTITPTKTSRPTATPRPELMPADVGLPWDNATILATGLKVDYKPCYVNTETRFHAGSVPMFKQALAQLGKIDVLAPLPGTVIFTDWAPNLYGQNIIVATTLSINGEQAYYQIVHFHEMTVQVGQEVKRGDVIGTLVQGQKPIDPGGFPILDMMIYHLPSGHNTNLDAMNPQNITDFFVDIDVYLSDDIAVNSNVHVIQRCEGNPK
jgi:biotin carboxyl carrier protein